MLLDEEERSCTKIREESPSMARQRFEFRIRKIDPSSNKTMQAIPL